MGEQFLQAWAVESGAFDKVIATKDKSLVAKLAKVKIAGEVRDALGGKSLEELLQRMVDGKPIGAASWDYRRCGVLIADVMGKRIPGELTIPGRGWQELAPLWKRWGMPAVARFWLSEPAWAKKKGITGGWPRVFEASPRQLPALRRDLEAFRPKVIAAKGIPDGVERFSDGEWPLEELTIEIAGLVKVLLKWVKAAQKAELPLFVWLDGQQ